MKKYYSITLSLVAIAMLLGMVLGGCNAGKTYASPQAASTQYTNLPAAAGDNQPQGIWVSGVGEISVTPDIASLWLGIEAQKASVSDAQEEAAKAMDKVMAALKKSGVAEKDIQTSYFSIQQRTRWDDERQQEVVIGFQVTNQVIAKIRNIKEVGTTIDAVVAAGGDNTRINNLTFSVDDPTIYYDEARVKAMEAAHHKAEQLAQIAGVALGQPSYISESSSSPVYPMAYDMIPNVRMAMGVSEAASSTSISPGEVKITLTIQIAYTTG